MLWAKDIKDMIGKITFWNFDRGYGFIQTPKGKDYFAHITKWFSEEPPAVGRIVDFDEGAPYREGKTPQAVNVRLIAIEPKTLAVLSGVQDSNAPKAGA